MNKLVITSNLPVSAGIKAALIKHGVCLIPGDITITDYGRLELITRIEFVDGDEDPYNPMVYYKPSDWNTPTVIDEKEQEQSTRLEEYIRHRNTAVLPDTYESVAKAVYEDMLNLDTPVADEPELSSSTALSTGLTKDDLDDKNLALQRQQSYMLAKVRVMKLLVERKKDQLNSMIAGLNKQVEQIRKVIEIIEIFAGINEEVYQIQSGKLADASEKITLRQQVLFMDEEVGDPEDGGLDFNNINLFDEWLVRDDNYKKIVPEVKGIAILRVRRSDKSYTEIEWHNAALNAKNKETYLFIRNGENLYRIWTQVNMTPRLFPLHSELDEVMKSYFESNFDSDKERAEDQLYVYQRNFFIIQGLLTRSQVLCPLMSSKIDIFHLDGRGEYFNFVYDDEPSLTDGRLTFFDYRKEIDSQITRGTRIYLTPLPNSWRKNDFIDRFAKYYQHDCNTPALPSSGIYTVLDGKDIGQSEGTFYIKYLPGDKVYTYFGSTERKKRSAFRIDPNDDFVMNYDLLDIDLIPGFLADRSNRGGYLSMVPILRGIYKGRAKEIEAEKLLVELLSVEIAAERHEARELVESRLFDLVEWWKMKVIWKRPIMKDDAKAWRMIKRRYNSIYKKLKI